MDRRIPVETQDLSFKTNSGTFSVRVGAIIIRDKKILMVKNDHDPYYYSVGGRVKINETSQEAVVRETLEETNVKLEIDHLAFIHEHFFKVGEDHYHEVVYFYLMKVNNNMNFVCNSYGEQGAKEHLHWLPLGELDEFYLFPEFFKTKLLKSMKGMEHIVSRE